MTRLRGIPAVRGDSARDRRRLLVIAGAVVLLQAGCGEGADRGADPDVGGSSSPAAAPPAAAPPAMTPTLLLPVDSTIPTAPLGENGWQYGRGSDVDVDGDGESERVVVAARAEVRGGQPLWDDGQPWQVYVQEESGELTVLFARYVQLGTVEARVTLAEEDERPTVLILEHLPDALILHEIEYRGPADLLVRDRMERRLDPMGDLASPSLP